VPDQAQINDNKIEQSMMDDFKNIADGFYDSIVSKQELNVMPEDLFVQYFLPYLSGKIPIPKDSKVYAEWVSIAGSPMASVRIIDPSTKDTLFVCKGIFDTTSINTEDREPGDSFSDIFAQYKLQLNSLPIVANNYINQELNKKLNQVESLTDSDTNVMAWTDILKKYGYITDTTDTNRTVETVDDLDYD